ncbi:flagellar basal-body rod modification protein FlgD [Conyzicola lurida]|uniref:Flagellar basal-body rod modification protein FlgD n=1 Tax=Conyzicola lurida TaxID=1172621 RepID=A0A841AUA9_9MICO|nr:flagellar hook capping FlgD N-terminal domain-containing protein [Conyzicola lurida]MBB5845165.1 flagellar basal-body rod modification protein FlgD [Conyzicola lurida]
MSIDSITGVVSTQAAAAAASAAAAPKQTMDSEVFMSLLVSQLRNQDPSSPMDTNEMISQTTQLAMMEKITELTETGTENFSLQMRIAASAIVGKQVSYLDSTTGLPIKGTADSVSFTGVVPTVSVGGKDIPLDLIAGITTTSAATTTAS